MLYCRWGKVKRKNDVASQQKGVKWVERKMKPKWRAALSGSKLIRTMLERKLTWMTPPECKRFREKLDSKVFRSKGQCKRAERVQVRLDENEMRIDEPSSLASFHSIVIARAVPLSIRLAYKFRKCPHRPANESDIPLLSPDFNLPRLSPNLSLSCLSLKLEFWLVVHRTKGW